MKRVRQSSPFLYVESATVLAPSARTLFEGLSLQLAREHVALVGRNGVGKSTLLKVLAGDLQPECGRVRFSQKPYLVPQLLSGREHGEHRSIIARLSAQRIDQPSVADEFASAGLCGPEQLAERTWLSHGEYRKLRLLEAKRSCTDFLLLDEPSEDLDEAGIAWLRAWLTTLPCGVVVVSHDPGLLGDFGHFFVASESGSRLFTGTLAELERLLADEDYREQLRYSQNLNRLAAKEQQTLHVARRRDRKKRFGRCSELDRATPRIRLNQKRDHAQVYQGRITQVREVRLVALRDWSRATRRALRVQLPLELVVPVPTRAVEPVLTAIGVSAMVGGRSLFADLNLKIDQQRVALVGANGAGKTTLLEILLGRRASATGTVTCDLSRVGVIEQGAVDWCTNESLVSMLMRQAPMTPDAIASLLVAHKFPLAMADRALVSLSPGERLRAALLCLFQRRPTIQLLALDEPTFSLDVTGRHALTEALRAWSGALLVASHDRAFLAEIGIDRTIEL
jgi:ATPase subunit of ABC transporter with duplicated ATPase domains